MRKYLRFLLGSTMTVAGLAAGVTPVNAAPKAEEALARVYTQVDYYGSVITLQTKAECEPINLPSGQPARSAVNTTNSRTIRLYSIKFLGTCLDEVSVIGPGEVDSGRDHSNNQINELGETGAYYYSWK